MSGCLPNQPLDSRIAAALGEGAKSDDIAALIGEVETAAAHAGSEAKRARARALDPTLPERDAALSRRQTEDAWFRQERLGTAVTQLRQRLDQVRREEEDQRRREAYIRVETERDKLATELVELYPAAVTLLTDLLARVVKNDAEINHVNAHLPQDSPGRLLSSELVARGLSGFRADGVHDVPRIARDLRLPAFQWDAHHPFAWPKMTLQHSPSP